MMNKTTKVLDRSQFWILVVDDDDTARRSLAEILRLEGYQVDQTTNAAQAVNVLQQKNYDVILLDLRMPIENPPQSPEITEEQAGLIVQRYVSETSPETCVIFLTAHGSLETAIEALRYNAEDYLLKPASPEQILAAVDKALLRCQEKSHQRAQVTALKQAKSIAVELAQSIDKIGISLQALQDTSDEPLQRDDLARSITQIDPNNAKFLQPKTALPLSEQSTLDLEGGLTLDLERREIRLTRESLTSKEHSVLRLPLTPTESKLMRLFIQNSGKVFTHQELVDLIQGYEATGQEAPGVLRPLISRLRNKLESLPNGRNWIRSIRGIGYVFEIEPE